MAAKSVKEIVRTFFSYLEQCNCDKASDYMEKQRSTLSSDVWPNSMFDILCDFALAEKNYSYANFMPTKTLISEQRENKNFLDFVYKTLFQDLEKLQINKEDSDVSTLIASLVHFISVRLKLLEFYDKLHNIGLSNSYINFSELTETIVNLQNEFHNPSPIDGVVSVLQYELESIVNLFKCHSDLENWSYLDSLLSLKRGSDAIDLWEECHQSKQTRKFGSLFKSITPALISWFKSFKLFTIKKFSLYFHELLAEDQLFEEIQDESFSNNLYFYNKLKMLQKKSEAKSVILVFDASELENFRGPKFFSPLRDVEDSHIKHQIMLSHPKVQSELIDLEKLLSENNKREDSIKNISLININDVSYLLTRLDLRVSLIMFFDCQPKTEEKERANLLKLATQLRCHGHFVSINRHNEIS